MAKGKAIVASRLPGVAEAVTDGVHGLLVPPGDAGALATALQSLLDDPDRRRRLGAAARTRAEAEFGLEQMIERVDALVSGMGRPGESR
jgi:glycosyltransferase involved in cell wall biosynthesis